MNRFQATSRCECQAMLVAVLDEKRHVLEGSARLHGARETAPAHSIDAEREHFDAFLAQASGPRATPISESERADLFRAFIEWNKGQQSQSQN